MLLTSQGCVRKLMKGKERSEKLIGRMKKKMRRGENGLMCVERLKMIGMRQAMIARCCLCFANI